MSPLISVSVPPLPGTTRSPSTCQEPYCIVPHRRKILYVPYCVIYTLHLPEQELWLQRCISVVSVVALKVVMACK
jgi:hypothetical protein